jgi:Glycosyl transferase family 2
MAPGTRHEVANLRSAPGELSFEARVGGRAREVWFRTDSPVTPTTDAALAACLMPAMRFGGELRFAEPLDPRVLRGQREFQAIQAAWSLDWSFGEAPLREVEVVAPAREAALAQEGSGRVAAFFSGGVDSWATVLDNPEVTDLIFVHGLDLVPGAEHQRELAGEVEARLRGVAAELELDFHVVETNLRLLSDPLVIWDCFYGCAAVAVAHFLAPLFDRVLISGDSDYEVQQRFGANWMVDQLWSGERLEIVDAGGRHSRMERLRRIAPHPLVRRSLRVCWQNPGGTYNCGRCRKCLMTMAALEAVGERRDAATFPDELDLDAVAAIELTQPVTLTLWEDVLDAARASGRVELEGALETAVGNGRRALGLPASFRRRKRPGPPPTVRHAVVVPVWRQARFLAEAVESALAQELGSGIGVAIVNDGCPEPETHRIGMALRDANPDRVAYLRQPNRGVSAARNAGIRRAFARWPQVETVFPLDADNALSPHTIAALTTCLEANPSAAWASPALEFFGAEQGEWRIPDPFLPYRQLFANQSDTGSLIRRELFEAGHFYDETIRYGFEDWELFLRASLSGLRGVQAGRCGFRYRRREDSMVTAAMQRAALLEAEIQMRHREAYSAAAMARREHAEAPRFALVRCDRRDVLLTASCDLEPRRVPLPEFARSLAAAGGPAAAAEDFVPAVTVLSSAATLDRLDHTGNLPGTLFRLQGALRGRTAVGLRAGGSAELAGIAVRAGALGQLAGGALPGREGPVEIAADAAAEPPPESALRLAAGAIGAARQGFEPLLPLSHAAFFEHRHIDELRTTFPLSEDGPHREHDTVGLAAAVEAA